MNHYILLESTVKLPLDEALTNVHWGCSLASPFIIHEGLNWFLSKLIYGNKFVKYLHWGINESTFEVFCTSFPKISQLECLFMISNVKLPV